MFSVEAPSEDYRPRPAPLFRPTRIVLAKGSNRTESRRGLAERICAAYPEAEVVEAFGIPHNRVDLGESDPLRLHERGKLQIGRHGRVDISGRLDRITPVCGKDVPNAFTLEGWCAGNEVIGDRPQRVDVTTGIQLVECLELLRAHIQRGAAEAEVSVRNIRRTPRPLDLLRMRCWDGLLKPTRQ